MPITAPPAFADLWTRDRPRQTAAYRSVMAETDQPVEWAYVVWDDLVAHLASPDNHDRSIAAQILANLAKSDRDSRILDDLDAIVDVTRDARSVTARHVMQAIWRVGVAGEAQRAALLVALERRYREAEHERHPTLVRFDIVKALRDLYDVVPDDDVRTLALGLIELEPDPRYRRKAAAVWRSAAPG